MKDQFGNYVVQKVLETCDEKNRELILSRIKAHVVSLKKYTYGKHIAARVEKVIAAGGIYLSFSHFLTPCCFCLSLSFLTQISSSISGCFCVSLSLSISLIIYFISLSPLDLAYSFYIHVSLHIPHILLSLSFSSTLSVPQTQTSTLSLSLIYGFVGCWLFRADVIERILKLCSTD